MNKDLEIERKFLLDCLPAGWKHHASSRIVQGYFPMATNDIEIRLRRKGLHHTGPLAIVTPDSSVWAATASPFGNSHATGRDPHETRLSRGRFLQIARNSKPRFASFTVETFEHAPVNKAGLQEAKGPLLLVAATAVSFISRNSSAFKPAPSETPPVLFDLVPLHTFASDPAGRNDYRFAHAFTSQASDLLGPP